MSRRPTTVARKECENAHSSINANGYAIIGDTVSATLYARRLIGNNVTAPITLINEGVDRTNVEGLSNTCFIPVTIKSVLHNLTTEQIHMVPSGDNHFDDDDEIDTQTSQVIPYRVGSGPLGDFISAYFMPRVGPWFSHSSNGRLEKFFVETTMHTELNAQEKIITNFLKTEWDLILTNSLVVKGPAILNSHYIYMTEEDDDNSRQLFLNQYHMITQVHNVDVATEVSNIKFLPTTGVSGLYNITGSDIVLNNVRPIWKTNPYTYLRIATNGGLNPKPINVPTSYRAVLPIPLANGGSSRASNGGVNLTGVTGTHDLITTHIAFSLYDLNNPKQSALTWLVQAYTTIEDLSLVEPGGKFADSGHTLLIVEAINTKNRRKATFNVSEQEVQVNYNDRTAENGYLTQFAQIVSTIYRAYTGTTITVDALISDATTCSSSGACQDGNIVLDYSIRESPLVTILQLASSLYSVEIYPNAGGGCPC